MPEQIAFISVVPSPYQRDLFAELATRPGIVLEVFYLESASPDSPWPKADLHPFETILPGFWLPIGSARCHCNWGLPDLKKFDLVVMNTLMSLTAQIAMRCPLKEKPWIFWGEKLQGRSAFHKMLSAPLNSADAIAGIGSLAVEDYKRRFPRPKHFNIPYYCNLAPFRKVAQSRGTRAKRSDEFVFLFCGQMIARKGLDILMEAFVRLAREHRNVRLFLVGREADLPKLLERYSHPAQVEYNGFQPPQNLPYCFSQADAFVLPSRHDGWGVVVNQALGAGLPIICSSTVGAAHDLIEPEVNGLMVPPEAPEALFQAMKRLVENRQLCQQWGRASLRKSQEWSPRSGADRWIEVFHEVLKGHAEL